MELQLIQALQSLGLPGLLFVLAFFFGHIGLIEFVKVAGAHVKRKLKRPPEGQDAGPLIEGFAVLVLSLTLGGVLGALLLGGVAGAAGITLPPPFAGALLGVVLGMIASGWVAYRTRQAAAQGVPADMLAEALKALRRLPAPAPVIVQQPAPQVTVEVAPPAPPPAPPTAQPLNPPTDGLRPMTPADVAHLGER